MRRDYAVALPRFPLKHATGSEQVAYIKVFAEVLDANLSCRSASVLLESEHFEV